VLTDPSSYPPGTIPPHAAAAWAALASADRALIAEALRLFRELLDLARLLLLQLRLWIGRPLPAVLSSLLVMLDRWAAQLHQGADR
jgi:hypothetical protein